MIWIAAVLAVFLFYQFVERRHKVIFGKIIAALAVISVVVGAVVFGAVSVYDSMKPPYDPFAGVKIRHQYHSAKVAADVSDAIRERAFKKVFKDAWAFRGVSAEAEQLIRGKWVPGSIKPHPNYEKYTGDIEPELSAYVDIHMGDSYRKRIEAAEQLEPIQRKRLRDRESLVSELRKTATDDNQKRDISVILYVICDSLEEPLCKEMKTGLSEDERNRIASIEAAHERFVDDFDSELNALNLEVEQHIEVCNLKDKPLNSYTFDLSGFDRGRSTPHSVQVGSSDNDSRFGGDIIIAPGMCSTSVWTGKYKMYSQYKISNFIGVWSNE